MSEKLMWVVRDPRTSGYVDNVEGEDALGRVRWFRGLAYRWVHNTHTGSFTDGDVLFHMTTGTTMSQHVTLAAAANLMYMAGVAVDTIGSVSAAARPGPYAYVQCYGPKEAVAYTALTNATPTAGYFHKGVAGQAYLDTTGVATQPEYLRNIQNIVSNSSVSPAARVERLSFINCL